MSGTPLIHAARAFIHRHNLLDRGNRVVVAVSGGIDSMVLLDVLDELRRDLGIELAVAHINHTLRGEESDADEDFVRSATAKRGLPFHVHREDTRMLADTRKQSIQEVARDVRYAFLNSLRTSLGYDKIATAHHADDNAETILFNVFRGAGVSGLSGIPLQRNDSGIIRPFLFATRSEITDHATTHDVKYREDSSNRKSEYTRNFIRHEIVPRIREQINPNLTATLHRTSELFTHLQEYLAVESRRMMQEIITRRTESSVAFDLERFSTAPLFLQEYILYLVARDFSEKEIDSGAVQEMLKIVKAESGSSCSIAKDIVLTRNRGELILRRIETMEAFTYRVEPNRRYEFNDFTFHSAVVTATALSKDPYVEYADADAIGETLVLRSWEEGDWFVPLGMKEKKKLSDFFIDEKIPLFDKRKVPILESGGQILWICGKRLDDRCKISSKTERILKLEYHPRQHDPI